MWRLFGWSKRKNPSVRAGSSTAPFQGDAQAPRSNQVAVAIQNFHQYQKTHNEAGGRKARKDHLWVRIPTIVAAVATVFAAVFTGLDMEAANKSAKQARRQADIAQDDRRPWVGGPVVTSDICPDNGQVTKSINEVNFSLKFSNVGKTPALNFYVSASFSEEKDAKGKAQAFCAMNEAEYKNPVIPNNAILPLDAYIGHRFKGQKFQRVEIRTISKFDKPYIFGCATYGSSLDNITHKTIFLVPLTFRTDRTAVCVDGTYSVDPN